MIAVIDSKTGNIGNLLRALQFCGAEARTTIDPETVAAADKLILPGVGAFHVLAEFLREHGLDAAIEKFVIDRPLLGICVGAQVLMEESSEFGTHRGLGLIPGSVRRLSSQDPRAKVPHVGWDAAVFQRSEPILGVSLGQTEDVYFSHSYGIYPTERRDVLAESDAGYGPFCSVVQRGHIVGCQFHLELSGAAGLRHLRAFTGATP